MGTTPFGEKKTCIMQLDPISNVKYWRSLMTWRCNGSNTASQSHTSICLGSYSVLPNERSSFISSLAFRCDRNSLTRQSLRWSVQPISSRSCSIPSSDILTLQYTKKWLLRFKIIQKHVLFFLGIRELLKGFCCQILMGKLTQRSEMSDINCELKEFLEKVHIARWWF